LAHARADSRLHQDTKGREALALRGGEGVLRKDFADAGINVQLLLSAGTTRRGRERRLD